MESVPTLFTRILRFDISLSGNVRTKPQNTHMQAQAHKIVAVRSRAGLHMNELV